MVSLHSAPAAVDGSLYQAKDEGEDGDWRLEIGLVTTGS